MKAVAIAADRFAAVEDNGSGAGPGIVAALATILRRHTDRAELLIGYAADGQPDPLALSLSLADDPSFPELVARVQCAIDAAAGARPGANGDSPALDAVVSVGGTPPAGDQVLWLTAGNVPDGISLALRGDGDARLTTGLLGHMQALLEGPIDDPERPVSTLEFLTPAELEQLLETFNDTTAPFPDAVLHELFAQQALRTPERIAVSCDGHSLTYSELEARANQLARHLVEHGVEAETLVGIAMERSASMLVGLLGIMKAGGAYVPVDPAYPAERVEFMLTNSRASVVVTEQALVPRLPLEGVTAVCLDSDWETIAAQSVEPLAVKHDPEQLAYVIYTSGSTGQPKGVQIPHRALINFLETMGRHPGLGADDVLVAVTTLSFDIAGLELYLPLLTGAQVAIAPASTTSDPRALASLLESSGATVMQATPTTWRMLLDSGWRPSRPLRALCGGEPLPVALADRLVELDEIELWNMYGPTETTIWSTCGRVTTIGETLTIGRPIANTTIYLLDANLRPVPIGDVGELWIGGDGLARGYRGRDDLTAERFVPDPFRPGPGARIYRTGDLARYRPDGEIEFLGRIDNQVKVRGFRIELGEIETVLTRHEGVAEAVVVARGASGAEAELAAYVIPAGEPVATMELREFAAATLPAYMVPATVTTLDVFPLTPNGKVDRKALPEPMRERSTQHELVAPETPMERRLVEIWERELEISPIGVTDNFFDLGVSSIVAATLFATIEHELGDSLPLGAIFRAPTIRQLAHLLEQPEPSGRWTSLIPIQPQGSQPPVFCMHGGAGTILHLEALSRRLGPDQPFYGLQSRGLYGGPAPLRTVEEMATHYLSEMRQVWPSGPWRIAGYCFGSIVAFELAQRLVAAGEEVQLLAMFNGPSPVWIKQWGWYGNQPSLRAKRSLPPMELGIEHRRARRRRRRLDKVRTLILKVPRALAHPRRLVSGLMWHTRFQRARVLLALGRPLNEQLREDYFFEIHDKAERAYEPRVYPGEIMVFYGEGLYEDPALGWQGLGSPVTTFGVPGEHRNNRQAMHEPAVEFVAARIQERLVGSDVSERGRA